MDYRSAIEALIDAVVDVVVGQLTDVASSHETIRQQGRALRNQAAARELFGPRLDDALTGIVGDVTRRSAKRYESMRRHPRYSSDPLINEVDDADAMLGKEIVAAQGRSSPTPPLSLALALIRVEAIGIAAGETPVAGRAAPRAATRGPVQRRRTMTAADIPGELAQTIFAAARGDDMAAVYEGLRALEPTQTNAGGIVTKVRIALERGGAATARKLAAKLRDAGAQEVVPPPADTGADIRPVDREAVAPPAPLSARGGTNRKSIKDRVRTRHPAATPSAHGGGR